MIKYNFQVIKANSNEWNDTLKKSHEFDFYHTEFYHSLEKDGTPIMLLVSSGEDFISLPLIIRNIQDSEYLDATSVYGYCGPIANKPIEAIDFDFLTFFKNEVLNYFKQENIISVFSRLHPLIAQKNIFIDFGDLVELNKTVSIDLTIPVDEQRRIYRKSLKSELNQLRRFGYTVEEPKDKFEIDAFIEIYNSTMDKLEASEGYYFSNEYFHSFLKNKDFESKLLLAKFEGVIVAGAIFTIVGGIMQYHLAGTKQEFIQKAPMKLILDEARLLGTSLGLKYLHLGGGVGGEDTDSLFRFKTAFSKNFHQFSVWKMVVDKEKYQELVIKKALNDSDSGFFPLYRLST
ncbi:GNAT family N-acetyltransferase [Aequorivita sp. Q41]|uniref:GNAT family N-acetyltransferase n=1 Tax=Aequorivita sp. Q41 TaxID=3153300 RepID=UPI00324264D2